MAKDGLTERIAARCSPAVKAALKGEMDRTGQSEGQVLEGIILHHLTGDSRSTALGTLINQLADFMSQDLWQTSENTPWLDDPYKHACLTSAIDRLLQRLKPKGAPKASDILLKGLEAYGMEHFAKPDKAGGFAVGNIAKRWDNTAPDPTAAFNDLAYIKAMLKTAAE
jgi:hypothetical protein